MIGRTLSRYRILERLGGGGMGEVFRAHDDRLDRDVALKVLAPGRGTAEDRERIRREARVLSHLNHPGISTVFDIESTGDLEFLVMELVRGETLQERLRRGPIPEATALDWGAQIAEALEAAHRRDVIHRDLKPANVMISAEGRVKLLDFGLALRCPSGIAQSDTTADLSEGLVVGTLAYMSPEQMLGRPLDARSDIYTLGIILFEMTTGERPFDASPATALINEALNSPPPSPRSRNPALSEATERVILHLLEKDPARRPSSAARAVELLRRPSARFAAAGGDPMPLSPDGVREERRLVQSIAVLPLASLSDEAERDFFADGMTEAVISRLAQIRSIRVVSRTSVMRYKETDRPLSEIARELGVDAVVEGAVSRFGGRIRVTAQLVDGRTDRHLWAQSYERDATDVLSLQSEVARAIAEEIRAHVTPGDAVGLDRAHRVEPEAYEEYLKGRFHWNRRTEEGMRKAIEHFGRSIALDPSYPSAYAGLADVYVTMGVFSFAPPGEAFPRARAAAERALALDGSSAEGLLPLAGVQFHADWDFEQAMITYRRVIELAPNLAAAHHWYADVLTAMRRHDEAVAESRTALRLDPLSLSVNTDVGLHLFYARRYDEAIAQQQRALELDPNFGPALRSLGGAYEEKREYDQAIRCYQKGHELAKDDLSARALLAHAYAVAGRAPEARAIVAELRAASATRYVSRYALAAIHVGLGERDTAIELLEEAYRARDRGMVWLAVSPRLDPIRDDPRLLALVRRMRLPE